ncbi:hypothetical protein Tco_0866862 [Tanacetum coccineum]
MYLTSLRLDIMFAVCACARFQVNPKVSHLYAVKRIFRYLKGQTKLGLWYPKDSPFDLVQTVVANSITKAEYIAASNCCGHMLWIQNQLLDYGYNFMQTKIHIDNESTICIVKNHVFHSKIKHIEIRHHFIRDFNEKKLIQMIKINTDQNVADFLTKAFDVSRFEYLIAYFLNAHPIKYALTVNPTIYTACIEQFWTTTKVQTVNEEVQIQALVDKKKAIITETSIRRDLQFANENGTECLPNATIFAELERMGAKTTAWNEFSCTMASAIIFQAQEQEGEGSVMPTIPQHTPTINQPSSSQPPKNQKPRKSKKQNTKNTKTSQAAEITKLKERVKKLERRNKSSTPGLKRLRKVGRTTRIESSKDEGLGDQEDASKQGRKIVDIDADEEVTLIDATQGRNDDNLMFDTGALDEQEVEVEKVVSTAEVTTASATTIVDDLTLAQTLIEIKATKSKAITTTATKTTTTVTRPKARGVVVQEPSEFTTTTSLSQPSQLPHAKDKGKAKMVEPEKPLKKKAQILIDEEIAQILQEEFQVELEEEERLARQKEEDANIFEWDNVQATIDADYELAARLHAQEQEELTTLVKKVKVFDGASWPISSSGKHVCLRFGIRFGKESSKKAEMVQENSSKRAGEELESNNSKKQKLDENVDDEAEMKKHMEIVPNDEVAIDTIPLATKPPIIVD